MVRRKPIERLPKAIVTISGPSGAGKSTLIEALMGIPKQFYMARSTTTRSPRASDDPNSIIYVSEEKFRDLVAAGSFLWKTEVHGNSYGTQYAEFDVSKKIVLCDVSHIEAKRVKERIQSTFEGTSFLSLYIFSPSDFELRRRLTARDGPSAHIAKRISDCESWDREAKQIGRYDLFLDGKTSVEERIEIVCKALDTFRSNEN